MKLACNVAGGPADCLFKAEGATVEETIENIKKHGSEMHPEVMEKMAQMSEEEKMQWAENVKGKMEK